MAGSLASRQSGTSYKTTDRLLVGKRQRLPILAAEELPQSDRALLGMALRADSAEEELRRRHGHRLRQKTKKKERAAGGDATASTSTWG